MWVSHKCQAWGWLATEYTETLKPLAPKLEVDCPCLVGAYMELNHHTDHPVSVLLLGSAWPCSSRFPISSAICDVIEEQDSFITMAGSWRVSRTVLSVHTEPEVLRAGHLWRLCCFVGVGQGLSEMEGRSSNMLALEAEQQELENPTYTEAPASWLTPHTNPFTHSEDSYGLSGSAVDVGLQGPGSPALGQLVRRRTQAPLRPLHCP